MTISGGGGAKISVKSVQRLIRVWRSILAIDPHWEIECQTCEMGHGDPNGRLTYVTDRWYALVQVDQYLQGDDLEETVIHELLELQSHEERDLFRNLLDSVVAGDAVKRAYEKSMAQARNRRIEKLVPLVRRWRQKGEGSWSEERPAKGTSR